MDVRVSRYRAYDSIGDDWVYSTRMATPEQIERIGAESIMGTEIEIDDSLVHDGWTAKNFEPTQVKSN